MCMCMWHICVASLPGCEQDSVYVCECMQVLGAVCVSVRVMCPCVCALLCLPVPACLRVPVGVGRLGGKESPTQGCLPCVRAQNIKYPLNGDFPCYFQYRVVSEDMDHEIRPH